MIKLEALKDVEGSSDHTKVVKGTKYNGIGPSSNQNNHVHIVEMNA